MESKSIQSSSSGISGGAVIITDETEQQKSTGQTAEQTVANLNRCYR
jgi:filamentous hemagglutinin